MTLSRHAKADNVSGTVPISSLPMFFVAVFCFVLLAQSVWAGGGQHYPNGSSADFFVGAVPPPGFYLINYTTLVQKDRLVDNDGNKSPLDFEADVFVNTTRWIWSTPYSFLGGKANFITHLFIPWYKSEVEIGGEAGAGGATFDDSGIGDLIFAPLAVAWHFSPNFHAVTALDVYFPTGPYDKKDPSSQLISKNHWTFEPVFAFTYILNNVDLSAKFMYSFNTKNDEYVDPATGKTVDLEPGQEFHFDWAVGYSPAEGLRFGAGGYYYQQVTDDKVDGRKVEDNRSRLMGIGPALKWWPNRGKFSWLLQHIWDFGGKNTAEGQTTWLKTAWAF